MTGDIQRRLEPGRDTGAYFTANGPNCWVAAVCATVVLTVICLSAEMEIVTVMSSVLLAAGGMGMRREVIGSAPAALCWDNSTITSDLPLVALPNVSE